MAKSKIIKDLATGICGLDVALNRLYLISTSIQDNKVSEWIKRELNGYGEEDELPHYRQVKARLAGDYQTVGWGKIWTSTHVELPTICFKDEELDNVRTYNVTMSIVTIIEGLKKPEYALISPLPVSWYPLFEAGTTVHVTNAYREITQAQIDKIVQTVKTRVLDSLIFLENKFGCLDDLDIDVDKYEESDISSIQEKCAQIVYNGCTFNDFTKAKMKNSNVGNDNTLTQQTKVEISPTVNINNNKKSLISRIFSKLFNRSTSNNE